MDAPKYRQWAAVRQAVEQVLHRWHPEFFPPAEHDPDSPDVFAAKIYGLIDRWMDTDLLVIHLNSLERETVGLYPGDEQRLRAAAVELLAIDFDAILDFEGRSEPES